MLKKLIISQLKLSKLLFYPKKRMQRYEKKVRVEYLEIKENKKNFVFSAHFPIF